MRAGRPLTHAPKRSTIALNMGTAELGDGIASALLGKTRRAVFALLFCHSDQPYYLRQIARAVGAGQGAVQRELARLVRAGLVVRTRQGSQVFFQANREAPVFEELRGLMVKTAGVADVLRAVLTDVSNRIEAAFIYGSMAQGTENANSDVDVMVIGDVSFGEVIDAVHPAEASLTREVNPTVYPLAEALAKISAKDHFITTVMKGPKIFLVGDDRELARLAG